MRQGGLPAPRTGNLYNKAVATETSYTHLREHLASILDRVVDDQEVVIVRRKGARDVAMVPAAELAGLIETAHLLRSPRNAQRLAKALGRAQSARLKPSSVAQLRVEMRLVPNR